MKKLSPLIILSILLLSGCGAFGGGGTDDQTNITPIPPQQPTPEAENQEEVVNEENKATAEVNNAPNALIPSTNPQERLSQITQGRGDPFGSIRPPAVVRIPMTQPVPQSAEAKAIVREPLPPATEVANNAGKLSTNGNTNDNNVTAPNVTQGSNNQERLNTDGQKLDADGKIIPYTPPEPKEAESVVVSGIADLRGQNVAFITTPWDNMTRSVRVGDTLSSQDAGVIIRVKDIRFSDPRIIALRDKNQIIYRNLNDSNGVVILEQYGQQVTKEILGNQEEPTESNS